MCYRMVINYDFPTGVEDYVHRIGRTGRAGATGLAYTFFSDQDAKYASDLIKVLEGANQRVPPEIREMASRSGGMGRPRRWGPSSGGRGGRSDLGYGGRDSGRGRWGPYSSSSSRQERGGGRGYDSESRDRYLGHLCLSRKFTFILREENLNKSNRHIVIHNSSKFITKCSC